MFTNKNSSDYIKRIQQRELYANSIIMKTAENNLHKTNFNIQGNSHTNESSLYTLLKGGIVYTTPTEYNNYVHIGEQPIPVPGLVFSDPEPIPTPTPAPTSTSAPTPSNSIRVLYFNPSNTNSYSGSGNTITSLGDITMNGTLNNVSLTTDPSGIEKVFYFSGSSYISFNQYDLGDKITITAWVRPVEKTSINALFASATSNQAPPGFKLGWNSWTQNNRVMMYEGGNSSQGSSVISPIGTIVYDKWQHLTYLLDISNRSISFYLNGQFISSNTGTMVQNVDTNRAFRIGAFMDGSYTMKGYIGIFNLYKNLLMSEENILDDYNNTKSYYEGQSAPTSAPTSAPGNAPLAPVISLSSKTNISITLSFTQESNGTTITNYKYSLNDGAYTAFSPADISSPVTISGLTELTTYNIKLKAVSANGDSAESNQLTETTYKLKFASFTNVGSSTWTAPEDVAEVQYLIVGGGGGGGGAYSRITELGDVPVTSTPQEGYWINTAENTSNMRYKGRMYLGTTTTYNNNVTFSNPVRFKASNNYSPYIGTSTGRVYNMSVIYTFPDSFPDSSPIVTNTTYAQQQGLPTIEYSNNHGGGSGGGAGGEIKTSLINPFPKYTVTPGSTYNVYVGAGGEGGTATATTESAGLSGEDSYFDTVIAPGGTGGKASRVGFNQNGGGGNSGSEILGGKGGAGGTRNGGTIINSEAYQWNTTYLRGTTGGSGLNYINFDGTGNKTYSTGGDGGDPLIVASSVTPDNSGKGGEGTGTTLNSYANGIAGGSGIVMIKYYTILGAAD